MHYRPLGKTGPPVSEIGYGAWGTGGSGWIGAREDESVRALHRAIELGVNFIDTARGYGESERIVGQVVREHRGDPPYVATKVPPKNGTWPAPDGIDPAGDGRGLDAARRDIVARHRWERNFYRS